MFCQGEPIMKRLPKRRRGMIFASAVSLFTTLENPDSAYANTALEWFNDNGIRLGGWINGGATFNPSQLTGFNGPVTFADRSNRFQLNQFNIYVQRPVVAEGSTWDFGGRIDFMFGTDAIFTQAYGVPAFDVNTGQPLNRSNWDLDVCCASTRYYGIAFPQGGGSGTLTNSPPNSSPASRNCWRPRAAQRSMP